MRRLTCTEACATQINHRQEEMCNGSQARRLVLLNMYSTILGPLDGSELGECSLEHIKSAAKGFQASNVVLLTVLEPVVMKATWGDSQMAADYLGKLEKMEKEAQQKAEEYLEGAAEILKKEGIAVKTVVITPETYQGPAEGILDYAEKNKVDLIVMSTHGRSGVSRWTMGSVSDKVVNYAKVPVLTVSPPGCGI